MGLPPLDKWLTWCLHTNIVVGIDADVIPLERKGILAAVNSLQLMMILEVRPAPQAAVNHMRKSLAMRNLTRGEKGRVITDVTVEPMCLMAVTQWPLATNLVL